MHFWRFSSIFLVSGALGVGIWSVEILEVGLGGWGFSEGSLGGGCRNFRN